MNAEHCGGEHELECDGCASACRAAGVARLAVQTKAAVTVVLFALPCYAVVWPLFHCHSQQPTCDVGWHSSAVACLLYLLQSQRPACPSSAIFGSLSGASSPISCSPHSQPFLSLFRGFRGTMSSLSLSSTLQSE